MAHQSNEIIPEIYISGVRNPGLDVAGYGVWCGDDTSFNVSSRTQRNPTHNQAEIEAVLFVVTQARNQGYQELRIFTSSMFVVNSFNHWIHTWKNNNWIRGNNHEVIQRQEFEEILRIQGNNQSTQFIHVPKNEAGKKMEMARARAFAREAAGF